MEKGYREFLELTENGRPLDEDIGAPTIRQALIALNEFAIEASGLESQGAWRLAPSEARRLEASAGYSPPGGWAALAGLACGCGVLEATDTRFESVIERDALADWSERTCRLKLLESFTRRLVPPSCAAGLFILLGIHPAWGLRLAHEVADAPVLDADEQILRPGWRDATVFPDETVEILRGATFGTVAAVTETLQALEMDQKYPVDALVGWLSEICRGFRERAMSQMSAAQPSGVPAFLSAEGLGAVRSNCRIRDFTVGDLVDSVLVPAGVVRRFGDGSFCVLSDVARDVSVYGLDEDAQNAAFAWAVAGEEGFMVA